MIQQETLNHRRKLKPAAPPTVAQQKLQRRRALVLCRNAHTDASLAIANRLALAWCGCGCDELLAGVSGARVRG